MQCLDEHTVLAFIGNKMSDNVHRGVTEHLDRCPSCLDLVTIAGRTSLCAGTPNSEVLENATTHTAPKVSSDALRDLPNIQVGDQVHQYTVLAQLGRGGMGVVYRAQDTKLGRDVALKFLRPSLNDLHGAQLIREAKTLAKLSHANILTVYEVSIWNGQPFVVTELLQGQALDAWARDKKPGWREIAQVLHLAASALEEAHSAQLVHRDIKPQNVVIDRHGEPQLIDFGLVRTGEATENDRRLVGTPAYMAPEQLRGQPASPKSDQFSFWVTAYELLCGKRPYSGSNVDDLLASQKNPPSLTDKAVPGWLQRLVRKGLSPNPTDRFANMAEVARALKTGLQRRRFASSAGLAAGLVIVAVGATSLLLAPNEEVSACHNGEAQAAEFWNASLKNTIKTAFQESLVPYASVTWQETNRGLTAYAESWSKMHREACEATAVHKEQSQVLLDKRMQCLRERRGDFEALTHIFAKADSKTVKNAVSAVQSLTPVDSCSAANIVTTVPQGSQSAPELESLLAAANAQCSSGHGQRCRELSASLVEKSHAKQNRHFETKGKLVLGRAHEQLNEFAEATTVLRQAVWTGLALNHHEAVVQGATRLSELYTIRMVLPKEAEDWLRLAESIAELKAQPREWMYLIYRGRGFLSGANGDFADALAYAKRALALQESISGEHSQRAAQEMNNVATILFDLGRYHEAQELYRRALKILETTLGPEHPSAITVLNNLANTVSNMGGIEESIQFLRKALNAQLRVLGPDHLDTARSFHNLADSLRRVGELSEAKVSAQKALDIKTKKLEENHPSIANTLNVLASLEREQGNVEEAITLHHRAIAMKEATFDKDHISLAPPLHALGRALLAANKPSRALVVLKRAQDILRLHLPDDHPKHAFLLAAIGDVRMKQGRAKDAVPLFFDAVRRFRSNGESSELAEALFRLAQASWTADKNQSQAIQFAEEAQALFTRMHDPMQAEVDAWLKDHHPSSD